MKSAVILLVAIACATGELWMRVAEDETFLQKMVRLGYEVDTNPELRAEVDERMAKAKAAATPVYEFSCTELDEPYAPTNIHELHPKYVNVMAAFGDSITAGNGLGAETLLEVAVQNRGEVWCIGGDYSLEEDVVTLTNVIRKFNPDVQGWSNCPSGTGNLKRSWLNVAVPGDTNLGMPAQATEFIERMKNDSRIDWDNDWKIVTMFVGGNDLCASCHDDRFSPENYGANFRAAIDIMYNERVPRLLVNLVSMFDVSPLTNLSTGVVCDMLHNTICSCAVNETTRAELRNTQLAYHDELQKIADDPMYDDFDDFTIVLNPHMRDMLPPVDENGDYVEGFLAPDCFHPSRMAHQGFAYILWNTLLIPVGHKPFISEFSQTQTNVFSCPTKDYRYIFTKENSKGITVWPPARK